MSNGDKLRDQKICLVLEGTCNRRSIAAKFLLDDLYVSPVDQSILGLSFTHHTLVLGFAGHAAPFPFSKVVAVEIIRDGVTLTQVNRGSQLLGAAVGGAVFGGIGALAGALSGSTRGRERITELGLKLIVDDPLTPLHTVRVLKSKRCKGVEASGVEARAATTVVERLHGQLLIAMRAGDPSTAVVEQKPPPDAFDVDAREWDARTAIHVTDWNGKHPVLLLSQLRELLTPQEVLSLSKTPRRGACTIKAPTPADAQHLAAAMAGLGISLSMLPESARPLSE